MFYKATEQGSRLERASLIADYFMYRVEIRDELEIRQVITVGQFAS